MPPGSNDGERNATSRKRRSRDDAAPLSASSGAPTHTGYAIKWCKTVHARERAEAMRAKSDSHERDCQPQRWTIAAPDQRARPNLFEKMRCAGAFGTLTAIQPPGARSGCAFCTGMPRPGLRHVLEDVRHRDRVVRGVTTRVERGTLLLMHRCAAAARGERRRLRIQLEAFRLPATLGVRASRTGPRARPRRAVGGGPSGQPSR